MMRRLSFLSLFTFILVIFGWIIWHQSHSSFHVFAQTATPKTLLAAYADLNSTLDQNGDGKINNLDLVQLFGSSTPTATPTSVPPTATPTPSGPTPTLPPPGQGIWISSEEIMALLMSGSAWSDVESAANSSWGSACLNNNDCKHDTNTLAGALVATRTGDSAMRQKTINGLQSAMGSSLSRALELSRGLQSYVIAADIIGYQTSEFNNWVREMLDANVSPHNSNSPCNPDSTSLSCSNIGGVVCTTLNAPNNWGMHARASMTAAALFLNDTQLLNQVTNAHKAIIGYRIPNHLRCENTTWHADSSYKIGVNRKGAQISGINVSGVLPEDWRRGGGFKWLPSTSGYMWEGMQGFVVTAVILHRADLVPFSDQDNVVVRAMDMLYGKGEAASNSPVYKNNPSGDDTWIPWVVNYYAGTNYPTDSAQSGKGMGWTDWTHAR